MIKNLTKLVVLMVLILTNFTNGTTFAYSVYDNINVNKISAVKVGIFPFNLSECCNCIANLIINEIFYSQYMILNESGYDWKRDQHNSIINREEIENLTTLGTIIKSDICYEVISSRYNLIDHGIPSENTPLSWALRPIKLEYVSGWAYSKNRVVKTIENQYFMARFYTTANPLINRTGWDKIEPVTKQNFEYYKNSQHPNYAKPYLNEIKRAYIWDAYTTYLIDDIVNYNGVEYIATFSSNNKPPNLHAWAWQVL